eukprot:g6428.t1
MPVSYHIPNVVAYHRSIFSNATHEEATEFYKSGDYTSTIAAYEKLFKRVREHNLTHEQLHICYGNRSAAYFQLGLYQEALTDADKSKTLAEFSIQRTGKFCPSYVKAYVRKGLALLALGCAHEASAVFNEGLEVDPKNVELRIGLEDATRVILEDLLQGKGKQILSLPAAKPCKRITNFAYSTPLHKIKVDDVLPNTLLTPQQAERDHHIRDTYNYVTIQTDVRMPSKCIKVLEDNERCDLFSKAVRKAVHSIQEKNIEPRLLCIGTGSSLLAMVALKAKATHVTIAERWLYLAQSCKETLELNGFDPDQYKIVYKRPTDLVLTQDVPVCCNICINDLFDEGLLTSGIIPAFRHCMDNILIHNPVLIPASATVFAKAIEFRAENICGFDMSAINQYRWSPFFTCGLPLSPECYNDLSAAFEVWHFDFYNPPEETARKIVDLTFNEQGIFNAVLFWYELDLGNGIKFSTSPDIVNRRPRSSLHPSIQFMAGELEVKEGTVYPLVCSHNTIRFRFDIEEAEYLHLTKADLSFPLSSFCFLKSRSVLDAYQASIKNAFHKTKDRDARVDALNVGSGTGILALMCAKAGCSSVVACDIHPASCDLARTATARNNLSSSVTVICEDIASLRRGQSVRHNGINFVVFELFDAGLLGYHILSLMECLQRHVLQHEATVVPYKAVVYCMGVELLTQNVQDFTFSSLDKFRWSESNESVYLSAALNHQRLSSPTKVFEFHLDGQQQGRGRETLVRLDIKNEAPSGVSSGGTIEELSFDVVAEMSSTQQERSKLFDAASSASHSVYEANGHHWGQALQYLDTVTKVKKGSRVTLIARREGNRIHFRNKHGVGIPVEKAPWKVQWGGGASIENPHFQRLHYCELLINDFKMRCRGSRHPSILEDLKIMFNHCGSLFLDPYTLTVIAQELLNSEMLCQRVDPCPSATPEAIIGTMAQEAASSSAEASSNGIDTQTRVSIAYALFGRLRDYGNGIMKDRKPWSELLDRTSFSRPPTASEAMGRFRQNFQYFRINYIIVLLLTVILCMVMNPQSLFVLLTLFATWIYIFIIRTSPLTIAGREIGDREKLVGMAAISFITVFFLTNVGTVLFSAILMGCCIIGFHGMMRVPDDLFIDGNQNTQSFWSILKGGEQTGSTQGSSMV